MKLWIQDFIIAESRGNYYIQYMIELASGFKDGSLPIKSTAQQLCM